VPSAAKTAKRDPRGVTIRIHGRNERIQKECTYPRAEDPKASKG
jgi:hypothetical protein